MNYLSNLTTEDLTFLKELAHELRTQKNYATAKPLVFKIREIIVVTGAEWEYAKGACLIDEDYQTYLEPREVVEILEQEHLEEGQTLRGIAEEHDIDLDEEDLDSLFELTEAMGLEWKSSYYSETERFSGAFLTERAAREHLEANYYHYNSTAHVYCTCGWRNPELEQLLEIVEKFDCEDDK